MNLQTKVELSDRNTMPVVGLGVYEMDSSETYESVTAALEIGYRHIDSAAWYENEKECGQAIRDFLRTNPDIKREDIFFTTKLKTNSGKRAAKRAIEASLKACDLGYIDLYLVHSPLGGPEMRKQSWEACLEAQKAGVVRSIGVSNYGTKHLEEMVASGLPLPVVNQVDLHPFQTRVDIVQLCQRHNIILQTWAPLVRGMRFNHPTLQSIAKAHGKDVAQVLLRYSLQKEFVPLPKSVKRERILSNSQIFDFELSNQEMDKLDQLDEELITDWEVTKSP